MRPAGSAALLISLMTAAVSAAAQEERGTTSATASITATAPASGSRAPGPGPSPGAVRGAAEGQTSNVQSGDSAALLESHSDSYWYGRFGYAAIASSQTYGGLLFGFGRRIERNAVGIDLLLFSYGGIDTHAYGLSLMTLKGLYVMRPTARTSAYIGGGAGWGVMSFWHDDDNMYEDWRGSGAEGEFTAGYSFARAPTSTRLFVQADLVRPFYRAKGWSISKTGKTGIDIADRHVSSLSVSIGAGW